MSKYKVEQVQQPFGKRWAVVFEGNYKFIKKTEQAAKDLADKLNNIRKRRLSVS